MESIYFGIVSSLMAYIIHLMQDMDKRIDRVNERLIRIEFHLPKRKSDDDGE